MKNQIHLAVAFLLCGAALAGVPVRWTAETSRVQPIALDAWRGDTLALECTLKSYGQPVALGAATASLMWQTNGMGTTWWQTNATVSADGVIRATWSPSMDPGAPAVAFFLPVQTGDGASYRAAGTLRFRPSPGSGSQIAQLPQPGGTLDFGEFNLVNAPWATLEAANEAISAAVTSATGALVIPPPVDLTPYATTAYVSGAITSATGALVIPPPVDLTPYATSDSVALAVQTASNDLSRDIQTAFNSASNRTDLIEANLSAEITSSTNNLRSGLINNISESAAESRAYADSVASNAQRSAIAAIPSLSGYATESYVSDYFATNYTPPDISSYASRSYADAAASNAQANAIAAIPSLVGYATESYVADYFATNYTPPDLSSYASRSYADAAASNAQATAIAAIPSLAGYATEQFVSDYFATNYTPPDLSSYASRSYADAAASNAQAAAIAAIPSLSGYATEQYVSDYFATNYTPPDLSSYASRSYADAAASNAQAAAIAAIPSLAGYATETYAQNAAADAASDALSAAQSYARDLSWAASEGNTRLVSLDGTIWQDATGTVWQVTAVYGWSGTVIDLTTSAARPITFNYAGKADTFYTPNADYWSAGGGTNLYFATAMYETWALWFTNTYYGAESNSNWIADGTPPPSMSATNITISTSNEFYRLYYRPVALSTNPVDRVLYASASGDAATAERALTYGTPTRWTDATGCVWEVEQRLMGDLYFAEDNEFENKSGPYGFNEYLYVVPNESGFGLWINDYGEMEEFPMSELSGHEGWWEEQRSYGTFFLKPSYMAVTTLVTRVAYTNETAPLVEAVTNLQVESALVYRLYSGSNVVAEVTNYNSQVHAPALRLMQLNESNEYVTVWTETNGLARTLRDATNYTDDAISSRAAPRAWSGTTSGLGAEAPSNTTWISTPTTVIAGGFEYAKFVDTYGEVWVLTSNGMAAEFNPDTNAYFRITADDGTPIFSVEKSDAQLVGANASGITVGETTVTMQVPVVSATSPTMYWRESLTSGAWLDEMYPPMGATVSWSGTAGSWVCTVSFSGTRPSSMFFKFNFLQEGGVVIRNNATTDLSTGIWVNGVKFVPSVSGNNLIWTRQQ